MPELYVGNVSKQIHQFCYRSLERPGVIIQTIPIGGQIRIAPNGAKTDLTTPEIDHIVDQHRIYGMLPVDEIDRTKDPFSGLCYSIGRPISTEKLYKAMKKREEALDAFGQKTRQEAALAVNSQIEEQVGPLRQLEMSFAEEEPKSGYSDDMAHLAEGIRVTRNAPEGPPLENGGRRGRR